MDRERSDPAPGTDRPRLPRREDHDRAGLAATAFGLFAIAFTPREENPRITVPTAIVTTQAPGRSRDEVLRLITLPLERIIGQIGGVEHVYETSQDGLSTITVRYRVGTETTQAYVDLYTRLLGNRSAIPADASDPSSRGSTSTMCRSWS